ncbi:transmembrane protein [Pyrus ussuriensis x Pyrus communis]|uniref:Transmembrane protein n=1 Tax=Pyrus ussuriensis x Pyrus communis TaxID=2448454 RepID=A0A5N5F890_9ROSA|nr:transmembrane protein [Pyrus ussuriensis x Pyrus communis]
MVQCMSLGSALVLACLALSLVVLPLILPPLPPPPLMLLFFPVGIMAALVFLAFSPAGPEARNVVISNAV